MSGFSSGKQGLGWFLAGMLLLSSQAWGLDLGQVVARNEADSAQILSTLGRDKTIDSATSKETSRMVQVHVFTKIKKNKKNKARKSR